MASVSEILFVDPSVSDLETILGNLRPEVHAIVLDGNRPAVRQIAAALETCEGLDAVHVIAHGAPGRVGFSAGDWSAASLASDAQDLVAIGRALRPGAELCLWSCRAGAGIFGKAFVAGLAEATGTAIAATEGLVGAAAGGGSWDLTCSPVAARPPLTAAGIAAYQGLLVIKTWNGGSGTWSTPAAWTPNGVPANGDDVVLVGNGNITITLNVNTANLNSFAFITTRNLTFAIGAFTLNVTGTSATAVTTGTSGSQLITIAGGTINDAGGLALPAGVDTLSGFGTLNIAGTISGTGTLRASGGLLDVFGTIASGVVLSVNNTAGSNLKIEGAATSAAAITINNANETLEVGVAGNLTISAAQSITNGTVKLDGGTLADASGITVSSGRMTGFGTVNATLSGGGAGTITASGGTLDLTGTVNSGPSFTIDPTVVSTLKFDGTATAASAISISSVNQTLAIGAGGSLTIGAAESITNGTISLSGGILADASGLTIGNGALVTGFGIVAANITATSGAITASGGTLRLTGTIIGATPLAIAANSILSLENTPSGGTVTFNSSSSGVLRLTGTTVDNNQRLAGFDDPIEGLNVGSSTTPTNSIDLSGIPSSAIDSITLNGTTIQVTEVAGPVFDLTLAAAPSGFVNWTSDGGSGTEVFLGPNPTFTARGPIDSWFDAASWGGSGVPPTEPIGGVLSSYTFYNFAGTGSGNNAVPPGNDVILLPASLGQATGGGDPIWTISDSRNTNQFTSSLSLTNQGVIYVNDTASLNASVNGISWTLNGDTAVTARGTQLFQNDGIVAIVGNTTGSPATPTKRHLLQPYRQS